MKVQSLVIIWLAIWCHSSLAQPLPHTSIEYRVPFIPSSAVNTQAFQFYTLLGTGSGWKFVLIRIEG
ncbi:hypothetical protein N478_13805 [Pseudoalteromonas luteoviolacea S4060-1]|uniref:Uncharacterized protein n=1 Tax=Pseudoalteromonas luteoviolacea S4060-1 TaxID=1365257 RepID=A0A162BUP4_9GAMM|nr:hypothetical protein N478_13805 [Pseudoalteromonas luteoviolacea S4060-1]